MTTEDRLFKLMAGVFQISSAGISADSTSESIEAWDSLGHMNLCVALEEEFSVSFDDQQVTHMTSVEAILKTLRSLGVE